MGDRRQALAKTAGASARLRLFCGHWSSLWAIWPRSPLGRHRRAPAAWRRLGAAPCGGATPTKRRGGRLVAGFEAAVSLSCHRLRFGGSVDHSGKWPREASEPGPGGVPAIWRQHAAAPCLCKGGVEAMGDRRQALAEAAGTSAGLRLICGHWSSLWVNMASHGPWAVTGGAPAAWRRLEAVLCLCPTTTERGGGRLGPAFEAAVSLPCHRLRFGRSVDRSGKWPREASEPGPGGVPAI